MTKEEENTLKAFETRVRQLIMAYNDLRAENVRLQAACDEKDAALTDAQAKARQLQDDYKRLRIAKMMEISNDDIKMARQRVNELIRKVDKCIALLGV